jgi:hypothetical protein
MEFNDRDGPSDVKIAHGSGFTRMLASSGKGKSCMPPELIEAQLLLDEYRHALIEGLGCDGKDYKIACIPKLAGITNAGRSTPERSERFFADRRDRPRYSGLSAGPPGQGGNHFFADPCGTCTDPEITGQLEWSAARAHRCIQIPAGRLSVHTPLLGSDHFPHPLSRAGPGQNSHFPRCNAQGLQNQSGLTCVAAKKLCSSSLSGSAAGIRIGIDPSTSTAFRGNPANDVDPQ